MRNKALICLLVFCSLMCAKTFASTSNNDDSDQASGASVATLYVQDYGAKCDWNGTAGTDDTAAFQSAINAASTLHTNTGAMISVRASRACKIVGTVNLASGITLSGPATIIVPSQSSGTPQTTFLITAADDVSIEDLEIRILSNTCGNNAVCSAIRYEGASADATAHSGIYIRKNTIIDSAWGIFIRYASGSGSLSDIDISLNSVKSSFVYTGSDGIHVAGRVSNFTVTSNRVFNRGDAAIAASSESPNYACSNGTISDNILTEDQVGLDNAGCSDVTYTGNHVKATQTSSIANPAFRSFTYFGMKPAHVTVVGNSFENPTGSLDFAAKIDMAPASLSDNAANSTFMANTISSLYLRGSSITVQNNTFLPSAALTLDYDGTNSVASTNNIIGTNTWQGNGSITAGANPGLLSNNLLAPQLASGTITVTNGGNFVYP